MPMPTAMYQEHKPADEIEHIAYIGEKHDIVLEQHAQMKSSLDGLSVWAAVKAYKKTSLICFIAAFSASLDGYQSEFGGAVQCRNSPRWRSFTYLAFLISQFERIYRI
jgi:hypothetical protein